MVKRALLLLSAFCLLATTGAPPLLDGDGFLLADRPREWSFPRDHGRHDGYKIEWWYLTGNLLAADGRRFGFQLTIFREQVSPSDKATETESPWRSRDIYYGHFAVSDVAGEHFEHAERVSRARPGLAWASDETLDVRLLDWSIKLDDGAIKLRAADERMAIDLACRIEHGPIFHGDGGLSPKGDQPGQASYYYSLTRLATTGSVRFDDEIIEVAGLAWMDQEFSSNQLSDVQVGWDWFSLHLDDGRDVMAYRLRTEAGETDYAFASIVSADGASVQWFSADQVRLDGDTPWTSEKTGGAYPQRWRVRIDDLLDLRITSRFGEQELTTGESTDISYFEGSVRVQDAQGEDVGAGYMELVGYADSLADAF